MGIQERKQMLLRLLEEHPGLRRKQLIERCIGKLGFSAEAQQDYRVDSAVIREKVRLGSALTALIENGDIEENEVGCLRAKNSPRALLEQTQAERLVMEILQPGEIIPKHRIFAEADERMAEQDRSLSEGRFTPLWARRWSGCSGKSGSGKRPEDLRCRRPLPTRTRSWADGFWRPETAEISQNASLALSTCEAVSGWSPMRCGC